MIMSYYTTLWTHQSVLVIPLVTLGNCYRENENITRAHNNPLKYCCILSFKLTWNSAMLQSEDVMKAAMAAMSKEKATFAKL